MAKFLLIHGAWHGGWCWQRVVKCLTDAGHSVFTPTLTGLSDRAHTLNPAVGLDTHVQDVVGLLDAWDLTDVVLVGHSYAGLVVSSVSGLRPARISRTVYVDAFVPDNGERAIDLLPESVSEHYLESVRTAGFGWLIPPRQLEVLGVSRPEDLAWLSPRLTPHPWKSYVDRVDVRPNDVPATYVDCTDWLGVFAPQCERARGLGFDVHNLATGHEAMVTAPNELAQLLHNTAQQTNPNREVGDFQWNS